MAQSKQHKSRSKAKSNGLANFLKSNPEIKAVDIAKKLGITQGFISQVKSGKSELPLGKALTLEILFGVDAASLNKEIAEIRQLKPIPSGEDSENVNSGMPT